MKRLHWLGTLAASAMLFSATVSADDHRDRRHWDRDQHQTHRWDRNEHRRHDRGDHWRGERWRGRDGRWDDRRYHHYRVPPGHRYHNGYRRGYWDGRYYDGHRGNYYRRHDYWPRYRRSGIDGTLILTFPL